MLSVQLHEQALHDNHAVTPRATLQLDELRMLVASQERWLPNSAAALRTSISDQLQVC